MRHKYQMATKQPTEDVDGTNNPCTDSRNADVNTNGANNPGIGMEEAINSNGNGNSKIRYLKSVSFSIKNITGHDYFMQLIIEKIKIMKK